VGKSVVQELADFIAKTEPNVRGFSAQNLWRMKQFYETYKDEPKLATLWREIPWAHHKMIMPCNSFFTLKRSTAIYGCSMLKNKTT